MIKTGSGLDLSFIDVTECAVEQEAVNKIINYFLIILCKNHWMSCDTPSCVDWPRKMPNQQQLMLMQNGRFYRSQMLSIRLKLISLMTIAQLLIATNDRGDSDKHPIFTMTLGTQCGHKSIISRTWDILFVTNSNGSRIRVRLFRSVLKFYSTPHRIFRSQSYFVSLVSGWCQSVNHSCFWYTTSQFSFYLSMSCLSLLAKLFLFPQFLTKSFSQFSSWSMFL